MYKHQYQTTPDHFQLELTAQSEFCKYQSVSCNENYTDLQQVVIVVNVISFQFLIRCAVCQVQSNVIQSRVQLTKLFCYFDESSATGN